MPLIPITAYRNNAKFPTPPRKTFDTLSFPNDLVARDRGFFTEIEFANYTTGIQGAGGLGGNRGPRGNALLPSGNGIRLPLPKKINDATTLSWNEISATQQAASLVGNVPRAAEISTAISIGGPIIGAALNPFQFMQFKQPNFKEFTFSWTLAPHTPQESETLNNIINACRKSSLPTNMGGLYLKYPDIVRIRMLPDEMGMQFKNCAIISVQVDFTGAGNPSFFRGTNRPTVINLTLQLKEIQLWDQTDYTGEIITTGQAGRNIAAAFVAAGPIIGNAIRNSTGGLG